MTCGVQSAVTAQIPHLYANGFALSVSSADTIVVLEQNGIPIATLNMSYTAAKTLAIKLGSSVAILENATERPMLTTDEVERFLMMPAPK